MNPTSTADARRHQQKGKENRRIWGDNLKHKNKKNLRIMFQNINGFGCTKEDEPKTKGFFDLMKDSEIDVFAMAETNVDWRKVKKKYTIWDQTKEWFENIRVTASTNQHDTYKKHYQPGGTAIVSQGEVALQIMESGYDTNRMGRWAWSLYRGKNNVKLRVVLVYRARKPQENGFRKAYCQQQAALLKLQIKGDPDTNFWKDLWQQMDEWIENGDQLVVCGDWNQDVRKDAFLQQFEERNLVPAILSKHGAENAPETYNGGSDPIDEIFVSSTLQVTAAGYLEHGASSGDHRPLWIDLDKEMALGTVYPNLPTHKARRLKTSDPRTVKRYLKRLDEYYKKHQVYTKSHLLYSSFSTPMTPENIRLYEELEDLRVKGMVYAEKKCRKLKMGECKWSPKLKHARKKVKYIASSISKLKGKRINSKFLYRQSAQLGFSTENVSLEDLIKMLLESKAEYNNIKEHHETHRQTYLEELASALAEQNKTSKLNELNQLRQRETQRELFRRIKRLNGDQSLATTFVRVNQDGITTDITEQTAMEEAIIPINREKFHQCEQTCPFLLEPLVTDFGYHGEGDKMKCFREGNYAPPETLDPITKEYINVCQSTQPTTALSSNRTALDYKNSWNKMKEKTSSRSLHFGHFKASCKHDLITTVNYILAEIPFQTGYSPVRWQNATDVMILKKMGIYDVDKLRTIVLYEADFNHNNKYLGKIMMNQAMDKKLIAPEQYSTPGRKAIDHALNKRLIFDIARYQKSSLAMTSCDLKSCYDRIVHTPAIMAVERLGIPSEPITSMFKTIESASHITRTAYGDSTATYGGQEHFNAPVMGVGQGNGCGPQVWAAVSSAMFEVLRRKGLTTHFCMPISKQDLDLCSFAYVDDTDLIQAMNNQRVQNNPEETIEKMQEAVNCWEEVAKCTGGAIATDKSWWYIIHFDWSDGKWSYGNLDNILNDKITCKDKDGHRHELKYIPSDQAVEMLGVYLAPDGNNEEQVKQMKKKTTHLGELVRTGHVDRAEAWTALTAVAMKSVDYSLPALTLSEHECTQIMWPLLKAFLPKSGFNRHYPRDFLYSNEDLQGLGLKNIYLVQGISHVCDIVHHLWAKTITGHLIQQGLEQMRLELGVNTDFFQQDYYAFEPLIMTPSWLQHTWQFNTDYGVTINPSIPKLQQRRVNDRVIMDEILQANIASASELTAINRCRLYLRVFHLSDITTANGKELRKSLMSGTCDPYTINDCDWPMWGKPPPQCWTIWRRIIRLVFTNGINLRLLRPLKEWINPHSKKWVWFLSPSHTSLFQRSGTQWIEHKPLRANSRIRRFHNGGLYVEIIPHDLQPTTIHKSARCITSEGLSGNVTIAENEEALVDRLHPRQTQWLFHGMSQSPSIQKLLNDLSTGNAIAVSDGSFHQETLVTTSGWIVESADGSEYISGMGLPSFSATCKGAYRGEITGLLAIAHIVTYLSLKHNIQHPSVHIGCDNERALKTCFPPQASTVSPKWKHSDIISGIEGLRKLNVVKYYTHHVYGHQDDTCNYESLPRLAQMNVRMDGLAKLARQLVEDSQLLPPQTSAHPLGFLPAQVHGTNIPHEYTDSIYSEISTKTAHQWWLTKGRYRLADIPRIHWDICREATNTSTRGEKQFSSKWCSGFLGTGEKMRRWNFRVKDLCPFCMSEIETNTHILHCQHHAAMDIWYKSLEKFRRKLISIKTDPILLEALFVDLDAWKSGMPFPPIRNFPPLLQSIMTDLQSISYDQFLEGLLPRSLIAYQDSKFKEDESSKYTGKQWGKKLYKACWVILKDIWIGRNEQLHNTDRIHELQGRPLVLSAIEAEYQLGLHRLPACEFSIYFSTPLNIRLQSPLENLRIWLLTIRLGRQLHGGIDLIQDDFYTNGPARQWLGLPKTTET